MSEASKAIKKVTLELGGKSPLVVFSDVDIVEAVEWAMFGCFWTNGQICSSTSRLLVQEDIAPALLDRLKKETEKISVGGKMRVITIVLKMDTLFDSILLILSLPSKIHSLKKIHRWDHS